MALQSRKILLLTLLSVFVILTLSYYFLINRSLILSDHFLMDRFFRLRGKQKASSEIVIVALDRKSSQRLGRKSDGWKRSDFSRAIQILSDAGADLIAVDFIFALPDDDPLEDELFRKALQDSGNVILATDISERNWAMPLEAFRAQEVGEGFVNLFPDSDNVVRKIPPPYARSAEDGSLLLDFPFSLQVALARLFPEGDFQADLSNPQALKLGNLHVPLAGERTKDGFYINFAGPSEKTFPTVSIADVLERSFNATRFEDKVVLIGNMHPLHHDYYPVPFRSGFAEGETMNSMYGVEIHANALHTLLTRQFIYPAPRKNLYLLLLGFALFMAALAIFVRINPFFVAGFSLFVLVGFVGICYSYFLKGIFVPSSPFLFAGATIALTGLIARQADERAQRKHITRLFGQYVAPTVVQQLIKDRSLIKHRGKKERLTIFFSDIRGFTALSERLDPDEISWFLNNYFSRMTEIVFRHEGTLDKFMGDAVMVFFGNPVYFENHAERAVQMALDMKKEVDKMKEELRRQGKNYAFGIGMGINTGEVVVGNLGSKEFFDYTVIGDEVNLACRLQSVATDGQILISENTYQLVKDHFETVALDPVVVKGKSQPQQVYEVVGRKKIEARRSLTDEKQPLSA